MLFTGSKFYSGPPFSGGLLVPQPLSEVLLRARNLPDGMFGYVDRSDIPSAWQAFRLALPQAPNFGQWLRWQAALEEMRAYYTLPQSYRREVLSALGEAIPRAIMGCRELEPIGIPAGLRDENADAEEFASPTIFPFLIRDDNGLLEPPALSEIYGALNRDMSAEFRIEERALAAKPCHIGQPVKLTLDGQATTALRIAVGSRNLFETWSPGPDAAERAVASLMTDVTSVLRKLELILKARRRRQVAPESHSSRTMETRNGR